MKASHVIALVLALAAAGWIVSGQLGEGERTAEAQKPPVDLSETQQVAMVRVRLQRAQPHVTELILRGRTEADRTVDVRAETSGRVIKLTVDKGDRVEAGQTIARLDDKAPKRRALKEAQGPAAPSARSSTRRPTGLSEKGFRAATQVAAAQAALEASEAAVRLAEVEIEQHRPSPPPSTAWSTTAWWSSAISWRSAIRHHAHRRSRPDHRGRPGQRTGHRPHSARARPASARLITGQDLSGKVGFIASMADQQTRTFRLELTIPNPNGSPARRCLGRAASTDRRCQCPLGLAGGAHAFRRRALVGVKLVDKPRTGCASSKVGGCRLPRRRRLARCGLPEAITLITVGHEFVTEGQEVQPVEEDISGRRRGRLVNALIDAALSHSRTVLSALILLLIAGTYAYHHGAQGSRSGHQHPDHLRQHHPRRYLAKRRRAAPGQTHGAGAEKPGGHQGDALDLLRGRRQRADGVRGGFRCRHRRRPTCAKRSISPSRSCRTTATSRPCTRSI